MKYTPTIVAVVAQQLATIFFMRVARWGLFLSAGLSAVVGLAVYFLLHFIERRVAAGKNGV